MELSMKETTQLVIFKRIENGKLTKTAAAKALGYSVRWVRKKFKRYKKDGPDGLVHGNRGKPSKKRRNQEQIRFAIKLLKGEFEGFGPTFASEKLLELIWYTNQ